MTSYYTRVARLDPPRRLPARGRGDRPLRGRPRGGSPTGSGSTARGDDLHRQRDRGDQPRRLHLGPPERRRAATSSCSPRWSTTPTSSPGSCCARSARPSSPTCRCSTTASSTSTRSTSCSRAGPKLVAVAHVSNVLGTINPVAEIVRRAHEAGAVVLIDGTQAVPQLPVDLRAIDADFYAWTGHKAYGPTGIGVLHGRRALLEEMPPFIGGGHMIRTVAANESTWTDLPWKFEAGTSQIAEAIGLGVGGRLDRRARHRARPRPRARRSSPRRWSGSARGSRADRVTARRPRPTAARSSRSRSTAPTRTTSARSSGATASASAPATTAPSR